MPLNRRRRGGDSGADERAGERVRRVVEPAPHGADREAGNDEKPRAEDASGRPSDLRSVGFALRSTAFALGTEEWDALERIVTRMRRDEPDLVRSLGLWD